MSLPARALRTIRKHDLFPRGARVLVALSGGADSIVLLRLLRLLEQRGELVVAGAAHLNHQLRGASSDEDEAFCAARAAAEGVAFAAARVDVAELARTSRRSIEDAGRTARYRFLVEAAASLGAEVVATGHSEDDQAETFLLRLIRGAGARGLAGIRPRSGIVVRPLLEIGRAEIREFAARHALAFREDASNADVSLARNRVRHELLPQLEQFSPAVASILATAARLAREDEEYLQRRAIEVADSIVLQEESGVALEARALSALPQALASRVARLALEAASPGHFIGAQHIDRLLALARGEAGLVVSLPGSAARLTGGRISFGAAGNPAFSNLWRFPLSIPGEVAIDAWTVSGERVADGLEVPCPPARGETAIIAAEALTGPLAVRSRRPGDRFRPLGMAGRGRKLQDFLVDRKIARSERDTLPLVVDHRDRIVWVVGQSVAEDFRVVEPKRGVILLKARRLGGVG